MTVSIDVIPAQETDAFPQGNHSVMGRWIVEWNGKMFSGGGSAGASLSRRNDSLQTKN